MAGSSLSTTRVDVAAQIYNPNGSTFGNEITVNNGAVNNASSGHPHVSTMPDGRFIVSWDDTSGDANNGLTEVRVFNPDGTPATDVFAIPGSQEAGGANDVTALSNTSFAVDWKTNATIEGQVLSVPAPTTPAGTTADLILRETTGANTGQLDAFELGNNAILAAYPLGGLGLNWQVMGLGAFAGVSNEADLIMRDGNTGNIEYFDIQGGQFAGTGAMGMVGVNWQVLGAGDFSGNANETDMIVRDSNTGNLDYFDIRNDQIVGAGAMGSIGMNWQPVGFGDVSGLPGESDLIMRDSNTGNFEYFDIQHNQIVSAGSLGSVGTDWHSLGVGSPLVLGSPLV